MSYWMRVTFATIVLVVTFVAIAIFFSNESVSKPGATLKVATETGHGSGVHVGEGYVLTAQHVVKGREKVSIVTDAGTTFDAEIVWGNEEYDVAVVFSKEIAEIVATIRISCRPVIQGEEVTARGNPFQFEFILTHGRVAIAKVSSFGRWKEIIVVDITGGPGMSGGPVVSTQQHRVVGIVVAGPNVGVALRTTMLVVPSSTICTLMRIGGYLAVQPENLKELGRQLRA